MAKKKASKDMGTEATAPATPTTKPVRLELPPDLHRLLRLVAADDEVSMASYAREVIEKHIRDEAKRRGIKG